MSIITKGIKNIENLVIFSESKIIDGANIIIDIIKNNIDDFLGFVLDKNIVQIGISLIIATNINTLTISITDFIISPIIARLTNGEFKNIEKYTIDILGIKFKIGILIMTFINFFLTIIIIFYIFKLTDISSFNYLINIIKNINKKN